MLAVETATCADADFNTRSTVGIMLNGHIIENMVQCAAVSPQAFRHYCVRTCVLTCLSHIGGGRTRV